MRRVDPLRSQAVASLKGTPCSLGCIPHHITSLIATKGTIMKKYSVEVTKTLMDVIEVEANSIQEAEELAYEMFNADRAMYCDSSTYANELDDDGEKIPHSWLDLPLPAAT